ncbi:hypothetical protein ES705_25876 [subsurface metagenome]
MSKRITEKLTFKKYYEKLGEENPQVKLRERIIKECGITRATFYKWLNGETNNVPKLAMEKISELTGVTVEYLFPDQ